MTNWFRIDFHLFSFHLDFDDERIPIRLNIWLEIFSINTYDRLKNITFRRSLFSITLLTGDIELDILFFHIIER